MPFISVQSIFKKLAAVIVGITERIATSFLYDTTASQVGRQVISDDGVWMMTSTGGTNAGATTWSGIRVYKRTGGPGTAWTYIQEILPPSGLESERYSTWGEDNATMSKDGTRIAVIYDQLYVYSRTGDVWSLEDTVPYLNNANKIRFKTATFHTTTGVDSTTDFITTDSVNELLWGNSYTVIYDKNGGTADIGLTDGEVYNLSNLRTSCSSSFINEGTGVITTGTHSFSTGDPIRYSTSGSKIIALNEYNTIYYPRVLSTTQFTLHPTALDATNNTNIINATMSRTIGTASRISGGSGYTLNDILTVTNGTVAADGYSAKIRVSGVSAGAITSVDVLYGGGYTSLPATTVLIAGQTQSSYNNSPTTEGVFAGGTGYTAGDVLTMSNGATVTVNTVSVGVVTGFTVTSSTSTPVTVGVTLTATGGTGANFTLTPDTANVANLLTVTGGTGTGAIIGGTLAALSGTHRFYHAKKIGLYSSAMLADGNTARIQLTPSGSETHQISLTSEFFNNSGTWTNFTVRISDDGTRIVSNQAIGSAEKGTLVVWERTGTAWAETARIYPSDPNCADLDPAYWQPGNNAYYITGVGAALDISGDGNTIMVQAVGGSDWSGGLVPSSGYPIFTASNPLYGNKPTIEIVDGKLSYQLKPGARISLETNPPHPIDGKYVIDTIESDTLFTIDAAASEGTIVDLVGKMYIGKTYIYPTSPGVFVYRYNAGTWNLDDILYSPETPSEERDFGGGGAALNYDGTIAVIGDHYGPNSQYDNGRAYVFERDPVTGWSCTSTLQPGNNWAQRFGTSVELTPDGNTIIVGAPWYGPYIYSTDSTGYLANPEGYVNLWPRPPYVTDSQTYAYGGGKAYLFKRTAPGNPYVLEDSFFPFTNNYGSTYTGDTVSITADGNVVAISSAPVLYEEYAVGERAGTVVVWENLTYTPAATVSRYYAEYVDKPEGDGILPPATSSTAFYGTKHKISNDGSTLVVCYEDAISIDVYTSSIVGTDLSWTYSTTLTPPSATAVKDIDINSTGTKIVVSCDVPGDQSIVTFVNTGTWTAYSQLTETVPYDLTYASTLVMSEDGSTLCIEGSYPTYFESFHTTNDVNGTTEIITLGSHTFQTGDTVIYSKNGGTAAIGLTNNTVYYLRRVSSTTVSVHTSYFNAIDNVSKVNLTASGAETHRFTMQATRKSIFPFRWNGGTNSWDLQSATAIGRLNTASRNFGAKMDLSSDGSILVAAQEGQSITYSSLDPNGTGTRYARLYIYERKTAPATFTPQWVTVLNGGAAYTVNDILTVTNGTPSASPMTIRVTGVSGGVITSAIVETANTYTDVYDAVDSVTVTGGTGNSAVLRVWWNGARYEIDTDATVSVASQGSGYITGPLTSSNYGQLVNGTKETDPIIINYSPYELFNGRDDVNGGSDLITLGTHFFQTGDAVRFRRSNTATSTLGLETNVTYYTRRVSDTQVSIHTSPADAAANTGIVNLIASGTSDTHRIYSIDGKVVSASISNWGVYTSIPNPNLPADVTSVDTGTGFTVNLTWKPCSEQYQNGFVWLTKTSDVGVYFWVPSGSTISGQIDKLTVSMSGDGSVIAAGYENTDLVYILERNDFTQAGLHQTEILIPPNTQLPSTTFPVASGFGQKRGLAVSGDGSTIAVGAWKWSSAQTGEGRLFIYRKADSQWRLEQQVASPCLEASAAFGSCVSVDNTGSIITSASPAQDTIYTFTTANPGANPGCPVPPVPATDGYVLRTISNPPTSETDNHYGVDVAVDETGTRMLIGGAETKVLRRHGNSWVVEQELIPPGAPSVANRVLAGYGYAVALSRNGDLAVVSAPWTAVLAGTDNGVVYIYSRTGETWSHVQTIYPAVQQNQMFFGFDVDLNGWTSYQTTPNVIVVATDSAQGGGPGEMYIFRNVSGTWTEQATVPGHLGNTFVNSGSVAYADNGTDSGIFAFGGWDVAGDMVVIVGSHYWGASSGTNDVITSFNEYYPPGGPTDGLEFGLDRGSLSFSKGDEGQYLVISDPRYSLYSNGTVGQVYIMKNSNGPGGTAGRPVNNGWNYVQTITPPNIGQLPITLPNNAYFPQIEFGRTVKFNSDGTKLLITSTDFSYPGVTTAFNAQIFYGGSAWVYNKGVGDTWSVYKRIFPQGPNTQWMGWAADTSDDMNIVTLGGYIAYHGTLTPTSIDVRYVGEAQIYEYYSPTVEPAWAYTNTAMLEDQDNSMEGNYYGEGPLAMSRDGSTLAATYAYGSSTSIDVYTNVLGVWTAQATVSSGTTAATRLHLSDDGNVMVVSDENTGEYATLTRTAGVWTLQDNFTPVATMISTYEFALSGDGQTLAISTNDGAGAYTVHVYRWNAGTTSWDAEDITGITNASVEDFNAGPQLFGTGLDLSFTGNWLAISGYRYTGYHASNFVTPAIFIFHRVSTTWSLQSIVAGWWSSQNSTQQAREPKVRINADATRMIIASPILNKAWVFKRAFDTQRHWNLDVVIEKDVDAAVDFGDGWAIDFSDNGDIAIIGTSFDVGYPKIETWRKVQGTWKKEVTLSNPSNPLNGSYFGYTLVCDSQGKLIATEDNYSVNDNGVVWTFEKNLDAGEMQPFPFLTYAIDVADLVEGPPGSYTGHYYLNTSLDGVQTNVRLTGSSWEDTTYNVFYGIGLTPGTSDPEVYGVVYDAINDAVDDFSGLLINNANKPKYQTSTYAYGGSTTPSGPIPQGTYVYPGVASVSSMFTADYNEVPYYGRPVSFEVWYSENQTKTNPNVTFSGYTHFGDVVSTVSPTLYPTVAGHVKRCVCGIIKKDADLANLTTGDIICGILYNGNSSGGEGYAVVNGTVKQAITSTVPVHYITGYFDPFMIDPIAAFKNYSQTFDYVEISLYDNTSTLIGFAGFLGGAGGPDPTPIDTYNVKWAWYYDFVPDAGVGTYCDQLFASMITMYTHPGWPV